MNGPLTDEVAARYRFFESWCYYWRVKLDATRASEVASARLMTLDATYNLNATDRENNDS